MDNFGSCTIYAKLTESNIRTHVWLDLLQDQGFRLYNSEFVTATMS